MLGCSPPYGFIALFIFDLVIGFWVFLLFKFDGGLPPPLNGLF